MKHCKYHFWVTRFRIGVNYAEETTSKVGYLANVKPTTHTDLNGHDVAALVLYFIEEDGKWFKAIKTFEPYFLIQCEEEYLQ